MPLPTADPYLPGHGDPAYAVTHYDLSLTYGVEGNRLAGDAHLDVELLEPAKRLVLDLAHLKVEKVRVTGAKLAKYSHRGTRLALTLDDEQPAGTRLGLDVRYTGSPKPLVEKHLGDAGWEELTDGVIVAAQPHGAPTWFPCNDRPDDKATYRLELAVPTGYHVASNGLLDARRKRGSTEVWTYVMDEPMATYLATVQIGRYVVREQQASVPLVTVAPADLDLTGSFDRQAAMLAAFEELFGPYPFSSYTAVITADELEIPLESQSLSTFGCNFVSDEWNQVRLIAHELAHQWFGNAVTLRSWSDIWLHEGFACYAEWLWSERSGGSSAAEHAAEHHTRLSDLDQDLLLADPGPELMFDDRVYKRGALALHAVRTTLGDAAFFGLLQAWVERHRGASVSTEEFLGFADAHTGAEVGALLRPWLYELPLPELPA